MTSSSHHTGSSHSDASRAATALGVVQHKVRRGPPPAPAPRRDLATPRRLAHPGPRAPRGVRPHEGAPPAARGRSAHARVRPQSGQSGQSRRRAVRDLPRDVGKQAPA